MGSNPVDYNMTCEGTDGDKNSMIKLSQRDNKVDSAAHLSEVSFFYENEIDLNSEDEDQASKEAPFILVQGASVIGKMTNQCEDAYFISERGFGVSDGVSGWNDYGFSSDQFSLQLMFNSKMIIEKAINSALRNDKGEIR